MKLAPALAALFLLCATPTFADDATDMRAVAGAFYGVSTALKSDGIPDAAGLSRLKPLVSTGLFYDLSQATEAQARFMARNKMAPPLLEGDIFSSLFEGAARFSVADCQVSGAGGQCSITLGHDGKTGLQTWTDTLVLVKESSGWRAHDIRYGGQWPFANNGSLRAMLKMAAGLGR